MPDSTSDHDEIHRQYRAIVDRWGRRITDGREALTDPDPRAAVLRLTAIIGFAEADVDQVARDVETWPSTPATSILARSIRREVQSCLDNLRAWRDELVRGNRGPGPA